MRLRTKLDHYATMKTNLAQNYGMYQGRYNAQMPLLVEKGLTPLTTKDFMMYRIKALQSGDKAEIEFWFNRCWDSSTTIVQHQKKIMIVHTPDQILSITSKVKLDDGALGLTVEQFRELARHHEVFDRRKIKSGEWLPKHRAKENRYWIEFAQGDRATLNEFADQIFAEGMARSNKDRNMLVLLPEERENPTMHAVYFKLLNGRSYASARSRFDRHARIFGEHIPSLQPLLEGRADTEPAVATIRRQETIVELVH